MLDLAGDLTARFASRAHFIYACRTPPLPRWLHAGTALRLAIALLVFTVGFTARLTHVELVNPTAMALTQEEHYDGRNDEHSGPAIRDAP